jgi:hypothetical protein
MQIQARHFWLAGGDRVGAPRHLHLQVEQWIVTGVWIARLHAAHRTRAATLVPVRALLSRGNQTQRKERCARGVTAVPGIARE